MPTSLRATQRRFLDALLEPLSGETRGVAELPTGNDAPSDTFCATADTLLSSTPSVSARERLELYHRQYWFRLLDSLAEDFPRLREFLGASYQSTAERYLLAQPPACWTLRELGSGFADFIRGDAMTDAALRPWAAAIANFEFAHMKVFAAESWPIPDEEHFASAPITLQPGVALVVTERPLSRVRDGRSVPSRDNSRRHRELHVVWRTPAYALRSQRERLSLLPLLLRLQRGGTIGAIMSSTRALPAPALIQSAFARWQSLGWLAVVPATLSPTEFQNQPHLLCPA